MLNANKTWKLDNFYEHYDKKKIDNFYELYDKKKTNNCETL